MKVKVMKRMLVGIIVLFFVVLALAVASPARTKQPPFGVVKRNGKTNYPATEFKSSGNARLVPYRRGPHFRHFSHFRLRRT